MWLSLEFLPTGSLVPSASERLSTFQTPGFEPPGLTARVSQQVGSPSLELTVLSNHLLSELFHMPIMVATSSFLHATGSSILVYTGSYTALLAIVSVCPPTVCYETWLTSQNLTRRWGPVHDFTLPSVVETT